MHDAAERNRLAGRAWAAVMPPPLAVPGFDAECDDYLPAKAAAGRGGRMIPSGT